MRKISAGPGSRKANGCGEKKNQGTEKSVAKLGSQKWQ